MKKTPKELTKMAALVAFGASVGLTAEVTAGPPSVETKKVHKKVDAKELKVNRKVDARKVEKVDANKLKVRKVNEADMRMDSSGGPGKPPPP